jgi:hypothetical protein
LLELENQLKAIEALPPELVIPAPEEEKMLRKFKENLE